MQVSEVFTTAPVSGRTDIELETYALLDRLGISYARVEHGPANTMEDCVDIDRALNTKICKNLFLCNRQKTDFYLLSMPGDKPFQTKELSRQLGCSRLSFAPGEMMEELLRCPPGSASILGLAHDTELRVRCLMDREIYESETLGCHPCINLGSMRLNVADIRNIFLPYTRHEVTVVDLPWENA